MEYGHLGAAARSTLYKVLSLAFEAPSRESIETILALAREYDAALQVLEKIGYNISDLGLELYSEIPLSAKGIAELRVEYTRLFLEGGRNLLREAAYKRKILEKDLELRFIRVNMQVDEYGYPADHIVLELEYMHRLALLEALAWKNANPLNTIAEEAFFLSRHLIGWAPSIAQVTANSSLKFYRILGSLLARYVTKDYNVLFKLAQQLF